MKQSIELLTFNRGLISRLGLARNDLDRLRLSASIQNNWMPRVLGSMMLRPGLAYTGATKDNDLAYHIPFVYANSDTAIIEVTDQFLRVKLDETAITRPSVSSAVVNGTFDTDLSSWTDNDESGATSQWVTGGYMSLVGTNYNFAKRYQQVTVGGADENVEHALRIIVAQGPVTLKVGYSAGSEELVPEVSLATGTHSIAFTPTGSFYIELSGVKQYAALVDSCTIEASGAMTLPTPWLEADIRKIRFEQSGNVVYADCNGYAPYKIIRTQVAAPSSTKRSWSIVKYEPEDGPFRPINITTTRLTPSALTGNITLTASKNFFTSNNVGSLFRITSVGQNVGITISGDAQFSGEIRVTGVGASQRTINITITSLTGTGTTVTLQRSVGEVGAWLNVTTYTSDTTTTYNDGLDNQIIYYRIGVATGGYSSGSPALAMSYSSGGLTGIARVTAFTNATSVSAIVLKAFGATAASEDWEEGEWSERRGYPSSCVIYEGRLWHAGRSKLFGSASDSYESFDDTIEGDSRPVIRTIGQGPVDVINWLVASQRLVLGGEGSEWVARSSNFDEPLTQDNINLKDPSTQGSAPVAAAKVDKTVLFVQKSLTRLFQTQYDIGQGEDYSSDDLTKLVPEIAESGIVRLAVQRQPDTRVHCVLGNGRIAILVLDSLENVKCFVTASTDGYVEDAFVLPGDEEDKVYYSVRRTINGGTVRYLERWALETEAARATYVYEGASTSSISVIVNDQTKFPDGKVVTVRNAAGTKIGNYTVADGTITLGAPVTYAKITPAIYKLSDSHIIYSGTSTATITGLNHLEGEKVTVFGDGKNLGTYTVASGSITLSEAVETCCVGLAYTGRFKSVKLGDINRNGTVLNQAKSINHIGLITLDTHMEGLRYGKDFDNMDDLPKTKDWSSVENDFIYEEFDDNFIEFDGEWTTDARVCLEAASPLPANVLSCVVAMDIEEDNSRDKP